TPTMSPRRSLIDAKSGRIRSTPGCASSGKRTPQSTMSSLPPYSKTVMLRPISPRPPSGVTRSAPRGNGGGPESSGCGWLMQFSFVFRGPLVRSLLDLHAACGVIRLELGFLLAGRVDQGQPHRAAGKPQHVHCRLEGDHTWQAGHAG